MRRSLRTVQRRTTAMPWTWLSAMYKGRFTHGPPHADMTEASKLAHGRGLASCKYSNLKSTSYGLAWGKVGEKTNGTISFALKASLFGRFLTETRPVYDTTVR
jgi:hypothetical protein